MEKNQKNRKDSSAKIMYFALLILLVIAGCTNNAQSADKNTGKKGADIAPIAAFKTISTGSVDSGDASVDLTPRGMENGKFAVDFSINTHSVDLSQFDLMKITLLEYDGKTIKPISAPQLSGHHNSGILIFDTGTEIKNFKIIIMGIPAVEERIFEWK